MKVELEIDGTEIPINEFVQKMLSGVILGGISPLYGMESDWKQINIRIEQ